MKPRRAALIVVFLLSWSAPPRAADWPNFQHDHRRSARTSEELQAATLEAEWVYRSPHPPRPAWAGPARWDAFAGIRGLRAMRNYDPVFHVIVVDDTLYFGSSADGSLHAVDASTGKERWCFDTDGPIRIAPAFAEGNLYFGSDDGYAYCVDARRGKLRWKFRPSPPAPLILNNGELIPRWPCRTGVLVEGGVAYFAASMLPWEESYLAAVDAQTGSTDGPGRFVRAFRGLTLEGALLATAHHLVVPQGRVAPLLFDRAGGERLGSLEGGGGCFALVVGDEEILHGPGNKTGWITASNARSRAKVATYAGGNAMVVAARLAYLLSDDSLTAIDRSSRQPRWKKASSYPYALILAADLLFVGGRDEVAAFRAEDGELVWKSSVEGRAYGLAVARGALFVSTDVGAIYCFRESGDVVKPPTKKAGPAAHVPSSPLAPVEPIDDEALLGRWVFQDDLVEGRTVRDMAGRAPATILGEVKLERSQDRQALVLDGSTTSALLVADHRRARLPTREMTVEAWARVDRPQRWGGLIGAFQDNGNYERGWVLGYTDSHFSFALAAAEGPGNLTYLAGNSAFESGTWYHVAGSYDGRELRIYVGGELEGASTTQRGDINYPPRAFYEIGAYHDDDEYFRLSGRLHELRVYNRVLSAAEIRAHSRTKNLRGPPGVELKVGPYLRFVRPDAALVRWETERLSPTILEYEDRGSVRRLEEPTPKTVHSVTLTDLRPNTLSSYTIQTLADGTPGTSRRFECDTFFNFSVPPVPDGASPRADGAAASLSADAARHILNQTAVQRGLCVVLGSRDGGLALELAKRSSLRILSVDVDGGRVASQKRLLRRAGLLGTRISVRQVAAYGETPFPSDFADLVVSEDVLLGGECPGTADEVLRILRPNGGLAYFGQPPGAEPAIHAQRLGSWLEAAGVEFELTTGDDGIWARVVRGALSGAGEWSHQYGRPDNSAYGGETLEGAVGTQDLDVQWIGRPGPRAQPDRNGRKPAPLAMNGRLFVQGLQRIVALNAYNGTILWSLEIPSLGRFNMPRDCGNWCADDDDVFVAVKDRCWQIDAARGSISKFYDRVHPGSGGKEGYDWSYVARHEGTIIGSAVKAGSAYTTFWGGAGAGWYDAASGPVTFKVASENLFALRKDSGATQWSYEDGVIINSTITIGAGRAYFVECRNAKVSHAPSRRVGLPELWEDQFLVALDLGTGNKVWDRPINVVPGIVVFYLAYQHDTLVLVSSAPQKYHVYAYSAQEGKPRWQSSFDWGGGDHGAHMSRPAIVGKTVYVRPRAFDLETGDVLPITMPGGGCGTYAAAKGAFFFRNGNVTVWNLKGGPATSWERLRPGCWLSTIPACGMLLSPEAGGGCSCGSWLETSIAFKPRRRESGPRPEGPAERQSAPPGDAR